MHSLTLTKEQLQKMIAHVNSHAPLEACGLLAGRGSKVETVLMVANQAQSPIRYVMDPIEQLSAFEWIDSNGLELIGIFHSHPTGPETVSPTDIVQAAYAVVYVILARVENSWRARGFWIEDGKYNEVGLQIL
ncbi:MAG: M67 family metallopeptidase [Chloroflexi bacterium]|nr:M67 family metallopeptidase [Chloroflexota bacterium]